MRRLHAAVVGGLVTLAATTTAGPSHAASPSMTGWWWRAQVGLARLPAPHVPEGSLHVAEAPDGETAVAAVRVPLPDGERADVLRLQVEGTSPAGLHLQACRTRTSWLAAHAGAWDDRPVADCATASAAGSLSEDGTTWSFPVAALAEGGVVDVVVLPADPAAGARTTRSVTFEPPGPDALVTLPAQEDGAGPASGGGDAVADLAPPPDAAPLALPAPVDVGPQAFPLPGAATAPSVRRTFGGPVRASAPAVPVVAATTGDDPGNAGLAALLLFAGSTIAAMRIGGRPLPPLRPLGRFRPPATLQVPPAPGGLGRFVRPRVGRPPSLS